MRVGVIFFVLIAIISAIAFGRAGIDNTPPPQLTTLFELKESFKYEVRYGFMKLGEVHILQSDTTINGTTYRHLNTVIQSNSSIPLVGHREYHYQSILSYNEHTVYSTYFWVDKVHRDVFPYNSYTFDYENNLVYSFFSDGEIRDTLELVGPADGGPALFHLGRSIAGSDNDFMYPVYIDNEKSLVEVRSTTETTRKRSPFFDNNRIDVYKSYGQANLTGPFGFSGSFDSFYDTSELRLPIEASVSVWVGRVRLKLIEYEKH